MENPENLYIKVIQYLIKSSFEFSKIKKIIKNMTTMIFRSSQKDEILNKSNKNIKNNLEMIKKKLVIIAINLLVSYIFPEICYILLLIYSS